MPPIANRLISPRHEFNDPIVCLQANLGQGRAHHGQKWFDVLQISPPGWRRESSPKGGTSGLHMVFVMGYHWVSHMSGRAYHWNHCVIPKPIGCSDLWFLLNGFKKIWMISRFTLW